MKSTTKGAVKGAVEGAVKGAVKRAANGAAKRPMLGVASAALVLAGCTSTPPTPPDTTVTHITTSTSTRPALVPSYHPPRPAARRPLPPGAPVHKGETERECPYIHSGLDVDSGAGVNLADLEGDRVYRRTVLTNFKPVGCRWYFYAPPYEAIAEIQPHRFATAHEAFDAMILTARTGQELITEKNFVPGVDGICFRTKFFAPDGNRDWAFVFAKGATMVIVYTQRTDTSRNALYIARAIARRF